MGVTATILTATPAWSSGAATVRVDLPKNRRLLVTAMALHGPSGSQGQQVLCTGITDERNARQYVAGSVPWRHIGHVGTFDPRNGPAWGASVPGVRARLAIELAPTGGQAEIDRAMELLAILGGPRAGAVIPLHDGTLIVELRSVTSSSDLPTQLALLCLDMGQRPEDAKSKGRLATPFWFANTAVAALTTADSAVRFSDALPFPEGTLTPGEELRHVGTLFTQFVTSSGLLTTADLDKWAFRAKDPSAAEYFRSNAVSPAAFAAAQVPIFNRRFRDRDNVSWDATKASTSAAVTAYLSHQFAVVPGGE